MATPEEIGLRAVLDMAGMDANSKRFLAELESLKRSVSNFANSSNSAVNDSTKQLGLFGDMANRVGAIVNGIIVADVFRGIAGEIRNVIGEILQATSDFQSLQIQFETLAARDFLATFGGNIEDALKGSSEAAKDLLFWVRQVAVTTPFTVETLGHTLAMSKAFGFTTAEAKDLVLAVGDFTAGMGLGDDVMKRILYNMGQMVAAGKPTGRELRDLSNSFVPVVEIADRLAKQMGKTRKEVQDMMAGGLVSAETFINEFKAIVGEEFPGAMERMSNTFQGVTNNIKDFLQSVIGFEVLGPVAGKLATDLQSALKGLLSPETFRVAESLGKSLAFTYETLAGIMSGQVAASIDDFIGSLGIATPTALDFAEAVITVGVNLANMANMASDAMFSMSRSVEEVFAFFDTSLEQLASNMRAWGGNVILQFAQGIADGIVFVIEAITAVAQTITRMLQANSPPLILPELEKWGTSAMLSYLEGWTKADFAAFNSIGGLLEKAIMSWGSKIDKEDLAGMVIGSTVALSEATEEFRKFGVVSEESLNNIANSAGFASDAFKEFIRLSLGLEQFKAISSAVKEALDFEGVGSTTIFGSLIDSFDDLLGIANKFGSQLSGVITDYARDSERLLTVNSLIKSSQLEVNSITKKYDDILLSLNEQLRIVTERQEDTTRIAAIDKALRIKILTTDERERLELEKKRILLEREIKNTQVLKDKELGTVKSKLQGYEDEKDAIADRVKFERDLLKKLSDQQAVAAQNRLDEVKALIEAQIRLNELYGKTIEVEVKVKAGAGGGAGGLVIPEVAQTLQDKISEALRNVKGSPIEIAFQELWRSIKEQVDASWKNFTDIFAPIKDPFDNMVKEIGKLLLDPELKKSLDGFVLGITDAFKPLSDFFTGPEGTALATSIGNIFGTIVGNLVADNPNTGKSLLDVIAESIASIAESLAKNGPGLTKFFDKVSEFINDSAFPTLERTLSSLATDVLPKIIDFAVDAGPTILDILGFLVRNADTIIPVFLALKVLGVLSIVGPILIALSPAILPVLTTLLGFSATTLLPVAGLLLAVGGLFITINEKGPEALKTLQDIEGLMKIAFSSKENFEIVVKAVWESEELLDLNPFHRVSEAISKELKNIFNTDDLRDLNPFHQIVEQIKKIDIVGALRFIGNVILGEVSLWDGPFKDWVSNTFESGGTIDSGFENFKTLVSGKFDQISLDAEEWVASTFGVDGTVSTGLSGFFSASNIGFNQFWTDTALSFTNTKTSVEEWLASTFGEAGTVPLGITTFFTNSKLGFDTFWTDTTASFTGIKTDVDNWLNTTFGPEGTISVGLSTFFTTATTNLSAWITDTLGKYTQLKTDLGTWATDTFGPEGTIMTGINTFLEPFKTWWDSVFGPTGSLSTWFSSIFEPGGVIYATIESFKNAGKNIVEGLVKGIMDAKEWALGKISSFLQSLVREALHRLGIGSPSKVFAEIGSQIVEGLIVGLDGMTDKAISAMSSLMDKITPQPTSGLTSNMALGGRSNSVVNNKNINVNVNAAYANTLSPVGIFSDVTAALASASI